MTKIAVSILSTTDNLTKVIKKIDKTDADYLHIDIMDGKFVSSKSFTFSQIAKETKHTSKKLDVHLMVQNPSKEIANYALLNVEYITIHYEIGEQIITLIDKIKSYGVKCGISINPATDVQKIIPLLPKIDLVLVMSVHPGLGGQTFLANAIDKIRLLKEQIIKNDYKTVISVDGGINQEIAHVCQEAGADIIVAGTFIVTSNDFQSQITKLRS